MSEVTMSAAQVAMLEERATTPYDPYLEARLDPILKSCKAKGSRSSQTRDGSTPRRGRSGRAPRGRTGYRRPACGGRLRRHPHRTHPFDGLSFIETGQPIADCPNEIVSAETYLGARGIVEALAEGADVVITGRIADGCLYLGPLAYEFGWDFDDYHAMARGMVVGHLLECGCQITGGYFADPGFKDVPDIANLGNPVADVSATSIVISKLDGTGGIVSMETCKEQLLYEVQDPSSYCCPDVVVDFNQVSFRQIGENRVEVHADAAGIARTSTLKALIGIREGYVAEEMVMFAGPGAIARAELTRDILAARFAKVDLKADEIRMDYVGQNSVHRGASPPPTAEPYEVVLRLAVKTTSRHEAQNSPGSRSACGEWSGWDRQVGHERARVTRPCLRRTEFVPRPARRGLMDSHHPHVADGRSAP